MNSARARNSVRRSLSHSKTTLVFYCTLLACPSLMIMYSEAAQMCTRTVGTYRDCLCGVMWRDVETQCEDELTYYQPTLTQENLTCPFQCLNGGTLFNNKICICNRNDPPSHGLCCETRKNHTGRCIYKPALYLAKLSCDILVVGELMEYQKAQPKG